METGGRDPRVALIFGGPSAEHEISIESARNVFVGLLESGLAVVPVLWHRSGRWGIGRLSDAARVPREDRGKAFEATRRCHGVPIGQAAGALEGRVDVVFPCLHGALGEDGAIQGFCRTLSLPHVGSPVMAHAVAIDKEHTKALLRGAGVTVDLLPSITIERQHWHRDRAQLEHAIEFPPPWIVKPVNAGSSVGLRSVSDPGDLISAVDHALGVAESRGAMVEARAGGEEITCAVWERANGDVEVLPPVAIRPRLDELFDYRSKYEPGGADEICPAPLEPTIAARLSDISLATFRVLGARGIARMDYMVEGERIALLEVNTMPGLTTGSLVPKAVAAAGLDLAAFLRELVELAAAQLPAPRSAGGGVG